MRTVLSWCGGFTVRRDASKRPPVCPAWHTGRSRRGASLTHQIKAEIKELKSGNTDLQDKLKLREEQSRNFVSKLMQRLRSFKREMKRI
jgi:hypothetical protein